MPRVGKVTALVKRADGAKVLIERSFADKTFVLTFEDEGGKTRYTARALHWTVADREAHEKMGFHEGWGTVASQLEEFARTLGVSA